MSPKSRLLLVKNTDPAFIAGRIARYAGMYRAESEPHAAVIGLQLFGWVGVVLPPGMHHWHAHNLVKWIEGGDDADKPVEDFIFVSRGEPPWDYWLGRPDTPDEGGEWLAGATSRAVALQVECPEGRAVDIAARRVSPMTTTLAMMARDVPLPFQAPDYAPGEVHATLDLALSAPPDVPWAVPAAADLTEDFARTDAPEEPDILKRASDRFWGMFRGKDDRTGGD